MFLFKVTIVNAAPPWLPLSTFTSHRSSFYRLRIVTTRYHSGEFNHSLQHISQDFSTIPRNTEQNYRLRVVVSHSLLLPSRPFITPESVAFLPVCYHILSDMQEEPTLTYPSAISTLFVIPRTVNTPFFIPCPCWCNIIWEYFACIALVIHRMLPNLIFSNIVQLKNMYGVPFST